MLSIKKDVFLSWLFVLSLQVIAASTAVGQPGYYPVDSLEWQVADAKVIVRATIVETTREPGETDHVWETVTLKVRETLQGKHRQTIKFVVDRHTSHDEFAAWKNGKVELLFFLVDSQRLKKRDPKYTRHELALRPGVWKRSCVELFQKAKPRLFTMSLEILTDPQAIVKQTRVAVAAAAKEKPVGRHSVYYGQTRVTVPIDRRLETLAQRWLKMKGNGREWLLRREGAKALGHFKSDSNVAIFKILLEDPTFSYNTKEDGKWAVVKHRVFHIRKIAYTTLQKWSVPVNKPVLREQLLRKVTDPSQRATITKIQASGGQVNYDEIEAPGQFRTVKSIFFNSLRNSVPDLAAVAKLKNLESVDLTRTVVRDLSPLTRLSNLRSLQLLSTSLSDLSPVAKMKSLTSLGLCGTQVRDLAPLSRLKNLESLDLSDTPVRDLSPLAELKNLKYLELARTRVSDISALAGLTNLESLNLRNTSVSGLTHLSRLKKLKRLQLDDTPVSDLQPITKLINLELLDLSGTQVKDVSSLAALEKLKWLDLQDTKVRDVSPLRKLKGIWPLSPGFLPKELRQAPNGNARGESD